MTFYCRTQQGHYQPLDLPITVNCGALGPSSNWRRLHPTEQCVLVLLAEGLRDEQIADRLGLAYSTVKNTLTRTRDILDIHPRTSLALWVWWAVGDPADVDPASIRAHEGG